MLGFPLVTKKLPLVVKLFPISTQADPSYCSILSVVVLKPICPATGDAGLVAVVHEAKTIPPLLGIFKPSTLLLLKLKSPLLSAVKNIPQLFTLIVLAIILSFYK
jgi:hypothetical protein